MVSTKPLNSHLSNDSLASTATLTAGSRKASREYDSAFTSRRSSKDNEDGSGSVEPVKEEEPGDHDAVQDSGSSSGVSDTKWSNLERKYTPTNKVASVSSKIGQFTKSTQESTSDRPKDLSVSMPTSAPGSRRGSSASPGTKNIKDLAEKWESRTLLTSGPSLTTIVTNNQPSRDEGGRSSWKNMDPPESTKVGSSVGRAAFFLPEESSEWESYSAISDGPDELPTTKNPTSSTSGTGSTNMAKIPDRKYSIPLFGPHDSPDAPVKMRENKNNNTAPSRPSSLIETSPGKSRWKVLNIFFVTGISVYISGIPCAQTELFIYLTWSWHRIYSYLRKSLVLSESDLNQDSHLLIVGD